MRVVYVKDDGAEPVAAESVEDNSSSLHTTP